MKDQYIYKFDNFSKFRENSRSQSDRRLTMMIPEASRHFPYTQNDNLRKSIFYDVNVDKDVSWPQWEKQIQELSLRWQGSEILI